MDTFWIDIGYSVNSQYFAFDIRRFPRSSVDVMNDVMDYSGRRLIIITDPHIKKDLAYRVYVTGVDHDLKDDNDGIFQSIFVKTRQVTLFEGHSWPGESVWIDFMNEGAHKFWRKMYKYEYFIGTTQIYGMWIDMNEPSVANQEDGTMPKTAIHILGDSYKVLHRDCHNVYGNMMAKATYEGLIERDQGQLRPFLLTRSAFLGT